MQIQSEGGHLLSIHSYDQNELLKNDEADHWLGGKKEEEGIWRWSDGTPWDYNAWNVDFDDGTKKGTHCLSIDFDGDWKEMDCTSKKRFTCMVEPKIVGGVGNKSLFFSQNQTTFTTFHVWCVAQQRVHSKRSQNMTGFRFWWHMKSESKTSKVTRPNKECGDWAPKAGVPKYKDNWLHEMSKFARQERLNDKTRDVIIKQAIQAKGNFPGAEGVLKTDKYYLQKI